jgi:hypothetical protein
MFPIMVRNIYGLVLFPFLIILILVVMLVRHVIFGQAQPLVFVFVFVFLT